MIHQPNCDKNTKGCAMYHEHGTPCIEIPCTCKGTGLPALKAAGRAEFEKSEVYKRVIDVEIIAQVHGTIPWEGRTIQDFLDTYADTIYQAAIDACLEALLESLREGFGNDAVRHGWDTARQIIRKRLSALKQSL